MDNIDYNKIGFKSGLEIHQQLNTNKLFCECPSVLRNEEPDFIINRKLHPVAGEEGSVDLAVEYQSSLNQEFVYQGYDTTCLVELDEEPPHNINQEALKIALQISLLLNCKILPITQIMRKTVIDGSNTSGFQRTLLIAYDGFVETSYGKVKIDSICLEEDAARIVEKTNNEVIFRLDRLGIPLIEIATAPDIKNPEQLKETALLIGNILRSCNVKRGIGTIRQDVNISIKGHPRTEIKGFQDVKMFEKTAENEVKRQLKNLENKKLNHEVRKALVTGETEFLRPMPGKARMYPETDLPLLKISRDLINEVKKNLPKLKDEIEKELQKKGLSKEMIKLLLKENKIEEFKELLNILNNPDLIVKMLILYPKEIAKKENIENSRIEKFLNKDSLSFVLEKLKEKKISESNIKQILTRIAKATNVEDAVVFKKEDSNIIEEKIISLIKEKPNLSENAYMGMIMKEFKGKVNGQEVMILIKKNLK
jgi:Glu-tRNA(Gln) amidotransferase subunit E-like FAD-binding protein